MLCSHGRGCQVDSIHYVVGSQGRKVALSIQSCCDAPKSFATRGVFTEPSRKMSATNENYCVDLHDRDILKHARMCRESRATSPR